MTNYLSFRVGHQWYGVEVANVIEVLQMVALDEMPKTRPDFLGLMTLREEIIPVVDLRLRFGLVNPPFTLQTPIIALKGAEGNFAVVVDDVDDVREVADINQYNRHDSPFVDHVARLADRLLLLLEVDRLLTDEELEHMSPSHVHNGVSHN